MFRMGAQYKSPAYINHDAIKFPGVGDYHIPSTFSNVGTKMGVKIPLKVSNTPGPLDYSPKHPSTTFKNNNTSTTFGTSNRNLIKGPE